MNERIPSLGLFTARTWKAPGTPVKSATVILLIIGLAITPLFAEEPPRDLKQLLKLTPEQLQGMDVGRLNLVCTEGLHGAENLDVEQQLKTLDRWADRVRFETSRNSYRYRQRPEDFERSEAYFRMLVMITVLQRDLRVSYNPERISTPSVADLNSGAFFADSKDIFLHGLLGDKRMGTCSSIPVLYVAIGRRLGYPLYLVSAKAHFFARWESSDGKERLNIDGGARGLTTHSDNYYKSWPYPIEEKEIRDGQYLKNLATAGELAEFLVIRAGCLAVNGRVLEAREAMLQASRLAPKIQRYVAALNANNESTK